MIAKRLFERGVLDVLLILRKLLFPTDGAGRQMSFSLLIAVVACLGLICSGGCGEHAASSGDVPVSSCAGTTIAGNLQDSLSFQPVPGGRVFLEAGSRMADTPVLSFSVEQSVTASSGGSFQLCSQEAVGPQAIVIVANNSIDEAYPPLVVPLSTVSNLGTVLMGSCQVKCGFEGQQQSSAPATLTGFITTAPTVAAGLIMARYALAAPDGSSNLWDVVVPTLNSSQPGTFQTAEGGCAGQQLLCSPYTFVLPSQKPVIVEGGEYIQQRGAPVYSVLATATGSHLCVPASASTSFQQDGVSPLTGVPGASLSVAAIHFARCR